MAHFQPSELFVHWQRLTVFARKMGQVVVPLLQILQHVKQDWAARIGYQQTDAALESWRGVLGEEPCVMVPATEIHDYPVSVLRMKRVAECQQSGMWGRARHDAEGSVHAKDCAESSVHAKDCAESSMHVKDCVEGSVHAKDCAEGSGVEIERPWARFVEMEDRMGCWLETQWGME